ncbi:hypothetical protein POCGH01_00128500 [Plasmodium ovale]|uniref:Uncharacterized protein n=1 Tax=Plasmodium ovale TaxID=36330 RepID=A0A1D3JCX7_PLAOA|nr:hypothetical protein POCGH01_00128500 [Plasmodium ovale]
MKYNFNKHCYYFKYWFYINTINHIENEDHIAYILRTMLDDEDDGECIDTLFINENDTRGDLTEVKIQGGKSTLLIEQNTKDVPSPHGLSQEPTSTVVFGISTGTETGALLSVPIINDLHQVPRVDEDNKI